MEAGVKAIGIVEEVMAVRMPEENTGVVPRFETLYSTFMPLKTHLKAP